MSTSLSMRSKPFVRTTEYKSEATPWLVAPMYSSLYDQIPAKAVIKSFASKIAVLKLLI